MLKKWQFVYCVRLAFVFASRDFARQGGEGKPFDISAVAVRFLQMHLANKGEACAAEGKRLSGTHPIIRAVVELHNHNLDTVGLPIRAAHIVDSLGELMVVEKHWGEYQKMPQG